MSIYGAMFSGVSGLAAQSQAMAMISDNISNVNTIGYKRTAAAFSTLVTESATPSRYSPGGVRSTPQLLLDRQGLLQASNSATDIGIVGAGFLVVNTSSTPSTSEGQYLFTRAGSFTKDANGNLRNVAGYYLQGWPIDTAGNIPINRSDLTALETVNVNGLTGTATATSAVDLKINLQASQASGTYTAGGMADGTVTPHFERSLDIFDSQGTSRTLTLGFFRDAALPANQWRVEVYVEPASDVDATAHPDGLITSGIVAFNSNGTLDTGNSTLPTTLGITWDAGLGVDNSTIDLNYGTDGMANGLTQYDDASQLISSNVNGAIFGTFTEVRISEDGIVTALFDNGTTRDLYKIPLATFPNPNGLSNENGNAFSLTDKAGDFSLQEAGMSGAGTFAANQLETSTVDLAEEFTNMIITQRAYSASGKIITTADEMLDELIRLKR